ncbi:hypothetical protein D0Z07_0105 [Hyphodiscus hymeniophilus]|uniref:NIMA interactive protein n=1 Tax=Hyphodiscus hymeniophilus TaxID=353542 RepID=A0A9P7B106_9HELO|nr:hypothetical protein D0Z07_0105 [Hyphodiscus hymeniophilus]
MESLTVASAYINNQLLSRGLLRSGQTIEFARPDQGDGGVDATMGRVISVINDLILRRDRDATQRESLSQTLRTLRADALRQTTEMERLQTKHVEAQRKLGIAEAADRAMKTQLRSAEQAARGLKEEMARMKILVNQTRAQCANDVRKRERVIEGLKKHVGEGGRARGTGKTVGVVNIVVTAGVGSEVSGGSGVGTEEEGYDLRMETNEFLTELARGLSEENENLGALVRRTVETLRTLSGCEKDVQQEGGMVVQLESGYENLAGEMEMVIEHLRTLLTNPSFVPLEEVEIREEEIIRLREGWERMEARWIEAVQMMDGWRKRMARSGQTVNLEELKMGLMLSPLKAADGMEEKGFQLSTLMEEGEGDTQADIEAMEDSGIEPLVEPDFDAEDSDVSESSLFEEEPVEEVEEDAEEEQPEEQDFSLNTASSISPGLPPQLSPLKETTNGNRIMTDRRRDGFTTILEENTYDLLQVDASSLSKSKSSPTKKEMLLHSPAPSDEVSLLKTSYPQERQRSSSPKKSSCSIPTPNPAQTPKLKETASSRLPRRRENQLPQQSPLTMATIAAKLAATEREADAARVRAKIKAARMKSAGEKEATRMMPPPPKKEEEDVDPAKAEIEEEAVSRKRKAGTRQGGRASRRRSTLSPWELESLILGGVGGAGD